MGTAYYDFRRVWYGSTPFEMKHIAIERIRDALVGTDFENQVWLVGGLTRDALLGLPGSDDIDLVTTENALSMAHFLYERGVSTIFPQEYARFKTAVIRVEDALVECITARSENYREKSRKPDVFAATLDEDALRRDFTVNSIYRNLFTDEIFDPFDGRADISSRILRSTRLDPAEMFREDPLRMLRCVRFRWKLGLTPAEGLYESVREVAPYLEHISAERIQEELSKMLVLEHAADCVRDLVSLGLTAVFAPEIDQMVGVDHGPHVPIEVFEHTMLTLQAIQTPNLTLKLAALLHDIGKPTTRTVTESGRVRFPLHQKVGAEMSRVILRRLRYGEDRIADVCTLVREHMRVMPSEELSDAGVRRLIRDLGPLLDPLFDLVEADRKGHPWASYSDCRIVQARAHAMLNVTPAESLTSPLTGEAIMEHLKIGPGKIVGLAKHVLCEEVIEGRMMPGDQEAALKFITQWWSTQTPSENSPQPEA